MRVNSQEKSDQRRMDKKLQEQSGLEWLQVVSSHEGEQWKDVNTCGVMIMVTLGVEQMVVIVA